MIRLRKSIQRHSEMLGLQRCQTLPRFHAFTGCDVVSSMVGIGKKTAWNAWVNFSEATTTFTASTQDSASLTLDSPNTRRLELLTVLKYSKNCAAQSVNEARKLTVNVYSLPQVSRLHPTNPEMLSSSMPSGLFTQQHSSGSSPSQEYQRSQIPVAGSENGMPEPTSGCHIGRICQMSATLARCCSNACTLWLVGVTASAIELVSIAVHCASAKGAALTM